MSKKVKSTPGTTTAPGATTTEKKAASKSRLFDYVNNYFNGSEWCPCPDGVIWDDEKGLIIEKTGKLYMGPERIQ